MGIQKYKVDKEEVKTATTTKIEATSTTTTSTSSNKEAPKIPWRSSSKHVVKEKLAAQKASSPSLSLVNVMISSAEPKINKEKEAPKIPPKIVAQPAESLPPVPPLPEIIVDEQKPVEQPPSILTFMETEANVAKDNIE